MCDVDDPETSDDSPRNYDPTAPRPPLGEAHGGYTFCATASWVLLQPYIKLYHSSAADGGGSSPTPTINTRALLRWCVQMQGLPIELGGFKGRTNKLVDGCYSWWVGGCVVLVETLLGVSGTHESAPVEHHEENAEDGQKAWDDADGKRLTSPRPVCDTHSNPRGSLPDFDGALPLLLGTDCHVQIRYSTAKHYRNTSFAPGNTQPEG